MSALPPPTPRLYRWMLRLLPRSMREEFGDDMARLFEDRRREAGRSRRARLVVWLRALDDVMRHAFAERLPRSHPHLSAPRTGSWFMERWLSDLRHALRGLRQAPGFTIAAVATLALGIGATVAIFSAVDGVLLRPLPYAEPDRLVRVWPQYNFNKALIGRIDEATPAIEGISGTSGWLFTLTGEGEPQQVYGVLVSWNHFELLGVQPALGRGFTPEDAEPGQADVVILSHGLWLSVFGGDPDVIGRRIELAAGEYPSRQVIGVMPPGFKDLDAGYRLWSPLDIDPSLSIRDDNSWYVNALIGRLADGATVQQATGQVRTVAVELRREWPARFDADEPFAATVEGLHDHMVDDLDNTLWTLLGAVGLVLLIGCVNVANLLLARGTSRRHDLAVRAALGASRGRLAAQLLAESLLLATAGCLVGLVVAATSLRLLGLFAPEELHQLTAASINLPVLAFAVTVSAASVLAFGLVPAWRAAGVQPRDSVGAAGRGTTDSGGRLTQALVTAEVALAVVLVLGSSLMLRSLWNIYSEDVGFDGDGVLTMHIGIPEGRFAPQALVPHYRRIWEAIESVPGVEQVGGIHLLPLRLGNWSFPYEAEGRPVPEGTPRPTANHRVVTPSYFETLRIPLLRGRGFTAADTAESRPVGMINQAMADELWPDEDPLGKQLTVFGTPFTVVGVAANTRQHGVHIDVQPEMYRPFAQWPTGGMFAVIRTAGDPLELVPSLRRSIWDIDPDAPLAQINTMEAVFTESVAGDRFVSLLLVAFGAMALVLGAIGVYGVTAYAVGRRLREFGVRIAVGADRPRVLLHALGDGLEPVAAGVALGVAGAWWSAGLLAGMLYDLEPYDPVTFASVPAVMIAIAGLACALPAWRASRVDPVIVLRQE